MAGFTQIGEWGGLGLSYLFIFGLIGIAQVLLRSGVTGAATTRKIVHIGVAHWWVIAMLFIDRLAVALIGPLSFILINWYSYRKHLFSAMEHPEARKNLGTVYFPMALTALVLLTWGGVLPQWYGLLAILVLGWGDGSASLVGEQLAARGAGGHFSVPGGRKSIGGTSAMFIMTGGVSALVLWLFNGPLAGAGEAAAGLQELGAAVIELSRGTWLAGELDSTVLAALSRLDGLARLLVNGAVDAGWTMTPSTMLATALVLAATATATELLTPWGLDNITVPLVVVALLSLMMVMPSAWVIRLAWAVGLNVAVAIGAYLRQAVTATGAVAGAGVGMVIYVAGGGFSWSILMAFFGSASVIGRLTGRRGARALRRQEAERIHAKGGRRDAVQVLANGGLGALMAALHALTGRPIFMLGFAIAMAAATADTWASEIGVLSTRRPVSILSMRAVPRGTSGGVSPVGLIASCGGALFIALWFVIGYMVLEGWNPGELGAMLAAITGGGFLGSLVDSLLGATVQAQYWDEERDAPTERPSSHRGPNRLVRGAHCLNNDAVNALSGALATALLFVLVV